MSAYLPWSRWSADTTKSCLLIRGLSRPHLPLTTSGRPADFLSRLAGRNSLHRRFFRQVLFFLGSGRRWSSLAGHHRLAEFWVGGSLLSAACICLGAAAVELSTAATAPAPEVGIAVGAAILFAAAATLILGVIPSEVLRASQAGASALQVPPLAQDAAPVTAIGQINP